MKRIIFILVLSLFLANAAFSQPNSTVTTKPIKEKFSQLPCISSPNFNVKVMTKSGKPYKKVEIFVNGQQLGMTNDFGAFNKKINSQGKTTFLFKNGSKQFTKTLDFSADSIYTINLKLHKPEYTSFVISSKPYDEQVYSNLKNKKDISLISTFILHFPNSKYKPDAIEFIEKIFYNNAIVENSVGAYEKYLLLYPKGLYAKECEKGYDKLLYAKAKQYNTMKAYRDYIDKSPYDFQKSDAEIAAYKIAQNKNTKSAYREYKNLFTSSSYASNASEGINKINKEVAIKEENRIYKNAQKGNISDCDTYLNTYPRGRYVSQVQNRKKNLLDDKELAVYETAKDGDKDDCNTYLSKYPSGKYVSNVEERLLYLEIKYADKTSDFDRYLNKYPSGKYYNDIKDRKNNLTAKLERKRKIKENSDIRKWDLGLKVCRQDYRGVIMGSIEQWNSSKSRVQIKIAASPGGLNSDNEKLTKGNKIWIVPSNGWHLCLQDEKEYAIANDKSDDFEKYLVKQETESRNTKKGKFEIGESVTYEIRYKSIFSFLNTTVKGVVTNWNSSFSKMEVKITNTGGYSDDINGQSIYEGAKIWVSPYSWK